MRIELLDHGYIELVETWGSDERIIEAARMSTGKGFLGWGVPQTCSRCRGAGKHGPWGDSDRDADEIQPCNLCKGTGSAIEKPGDEKLLKFLWDNNHATPFEMAGAIIEVKVPIMVLREWHRHRTQGYNEMSARYTPLPNENYVPTVDRLMRNSKTNKQAGTVAGAAELTPAVALEYQARLADEYTRQEELYQWSMSVGVPKELARLHIGVGRYSRMRATAVLRNWLGFLSLRLPENAQWEIRQCAEGLSTLLESAFPRTMALFQGGRR